jgi:hypothetical protein
LEAAKGGGEAISILSWFRGDPEIGRWPISAPT